MFFTNVCLIYQLKRPKVEDMTYISYTNLSEVRFHDFYTSLLHLFSGTLMTVYTKLKIFGIFDDGNVWKCFRFTSRFQPDATVPQGMLKSRAQFSRVQRSVVVLSTTLWLRNRCRKWRGFKGGGVMWEVFFCWK